MNLKELSNQELRGKEIEHDNLYNEGAEGYNPYRAEIERKNNLITTDRTPDDILQDIERVTDKNKRASLEKEYDLAVQAEKDRFAAEWTLETTKARRSEWNGIVDAGLVTSNNKIDWIKVSEQQQRQGWYMSDLQKAVKLHQL